MTTTQRLMLGDVIQAVSAVSANDHEVLATLSHLVNSGRVCLGKTPKGAHVDTHVRLPIPHRRIFADDGWTA